MQSPGFRGRGVGRYAHDWAVALERVRPDLVARYLLNPSLPPPGALDSLLATGKVRYLDAPDALPEGTRVLHSLSPLDPDVPVRDLWPDRAARARIVRSAAVYDLIPALDPEHELADPRFRARYRVRTELLRSARQLHALSRSVARDATRVLGTDPRDVFVVGAAPAPWFAPPSDRVAAAARARSLVPGLERPFVLYPTGSHPRKNNERLVRAWSLLAPEVRGSRQLVLTGDIPGSTANHYDHLARTHGAPGSVLTTGFVDDELLLALYQGADLVCVASLSEGFGLPVAEALACGTPVVASDVPPLDEFVDEAHRFDPTDDAAVARAITRHLDAGVRALQRPASVPPTWDAVASRSAAAFDSLLAGTASARRSGRRTRPVVAFASPFPPAPTGVAAYSHRLVEELVATGHVTVDAFPDGPATGQRPPDGVASLPLRSLPSLDLARGGYDAVVYSLGNSHHHLGALASLRRLPGTVVSHDVRLTNLYRHEHGDPTLPAGGLARAIRAMYGPALPEELGREGAVTDSELERYGLFMCREVVGCSERFLVSSHAAVQLTGVDVGAALESRVEVLPFACERPGRLPGFAPEHTAPPGSLPPGIRSSWGTGPDAIPAGAPVVAHFGIVDPAKEPGSLVDALALLVPRVPGLVLALVGPVADSLAVELASRAADAGVAGSLVLTGPVEPEVYRAWSDRATVAVQLRRSTNGEASAAVGECLASGIPTIVTDLGWSRELPDDAVVRVPARCDSTTLAAVVAELVRDAPRRAALSAAGRHEAGRRSFARTADALLSVVLGPRSRDPGPPRAGHRARDALR
ncbi:MAG: glycosyltransferase [Actinomycetota bacterium]|nr:glycosyltransferase [Actinomycetota bacterium]